MLAGIKFYICHRTEVYMIDRDY